MALVKVNRDNLGLYYEKCNSVGCFVRTNLLKCGSCKAVAYCGAQHQRADWPRHKTSCRIAKDARAQVDREKTVLLNDPEDLLEDVETNGAIGSFWIIPETRPYMRAQFSLMQALLAIRTGEAVDQALEQALEMLRLCRGDNQGVRTYVPAMLIRMGRDQEAYDFIKWWAVGTDSNYDWEDNEQPYLNLKGEDVLDPDFENWNFDFQLSFDVILTLMFVRLVIDVGMLSAESKKKRMTNEEKMALLKEEAGSDILLNRPDLVYQDNYDALEEKLAHMCTKAYQKVKKTNRYFWPAIMRPDRYANAPLAIYSAGSESQAVLAFRESWYAFADNERALEAVHELYRLDNGGQ